VPVEAIFRVGEAFTEIVLTAVLVQPDAVTIPVTVKVVLICGVAAYTAVEGPPVHTYVFAPLAERLVTFPEQITVGLAVVFNVGVMFTESV